MFFVLVLVTVSAQEGAYDCDDNPDDDPSICQGTINCDNPIYLVCAECIFPGQTEICDDKTDNDCNVNEGYQLDLDKATGVDAKDISCCDIDFNNAFWKDVDDQIIPEDVNLEEGTIVVLEVNGTIGCQDKEVVFDVLEQDISILPPAITYQDGPGNPDEGIIATFVYDSELGYAVARAQWNLVWYKGDAFSNIVEYVFNATPSDSNIEGELSQVINVYESAVGCEIEEARWSTGYDTNYMKHDDQVKLVVDTIGSDCEGLTMDFELYEDDGWLGDDYLGDIGAEYQPDSVVMSSVSPTEQIWTATYHIDNDDNDVDKGEYYDLEYYFKAIIGEKEQTSDNANIRICDEYDADCDGICDPGEIGIYCSTGENGEGDKCPDTPFGAVVDLEGCSETQRDCLAYWDCSAVEWEDHCDDEPPIFTRDVGDCTDIIGNPSACKCTYSGQGTECEGLGITPPTIKGCVVSETFPVFTGFNVFLVVVLLSLYYVFKKK